MRRLLPLAAAVLVVAGCGADDAAPTVDFRAAATAVTAGPTQYCDLEFTDCRNDDAAPVRLEVPPGTPVQVNVPEEIAETPWHVVYIYRDAGGEQREDTSGVFGPGTRDTHRLELPTSEDRLLTAQVQQFGPPPQADPDTGDIEFPIRGSWVLLADSAGPG